MCEGAKRKNQQPGRAMASIEIQSGQSDYDEKKKRVAKYPAVTKGLSEEELPYRFIDNIRQKGAYKEQPYIYIASQ